MIQTALDRLMELVFSLDMLAEKAAISYIEAVDPKTVPEVVCLDPRFYALGFEHVVMSLDTSVEKEADDPEYFCCDAYALQLSEFDKVALGIIATECVTAKDLVSWLEARRVVDGICAAVDGLKVPGNEVVN